NNAGLAASTKYYYRLYATISIGNSAYSDVRSTTTTAANSMIPAITSAATAGGTMGSSFNYSITASNSPASYGATNLPSGLTVNSSTGVISGTPAIAPSSVTTYTVIITAKNANGTGSKALTISIASVATPYGGSPAAIPGKI